MAQPMANELDKSLRLTAERLRAERNRALEEQAERERKGRELVVKLSSSVAEWRKRVLTNIVEAVGAANRIIAEFNIQLSSAASQEPTPKVAAAQGYSTPLPVVEIFQVIPDPFVPISGKSLNPAQRKAEQNARMQATMQKRATMIRLRLAINDAGLVSVTKHNYKHHPKDINLSIEISELTNEVIEGLVANFVNEGLFGWEDENSTGTPMVGSAVTLDERDDGQNQSAANSAPTVDQQVRTQIINAVHANQQSIELTASSLVALLDDRIEAFSVPNSEEGKAELEEYLELKAKVEAFLQAISQFLADATKDLPAINATISLRTGLNNWWSKAHVEICERSFDSALFGIGLTVCYLAGAGGVLSAIIPATLVKGKPVVDAIAKWCAHGH